MPMYEFQCQDCKAHFETLVSLSERIEDVTCKNCGSGKVKKTISAASFRLASSSGSIPSGALSGCSSKSGFS